MEIIFQDNNILAVNKKAGISVYPSDENPKEKTMISELLKTNPSLKNAGSAPRYGVVHRLDKNTSGVLIIAKNDGALEFLQDQFAQRKISKKYLTLVDKKVKNQEGIIHTYISRNPQNRLLQQAFKISPENDRKKGMREAITTWRVLKIFNNFTLLEISPKTGRRHQIRAHMQFIGHPIVGDKSYGFRSEMPKNLKRIFLHAYSIEITLPNKKRKKIIAKLPRDLDSVIKNLSKG